MSLATVFVAAGTPAPNGDQPLPSAASHGGTLLFFFIAGAIVLIGYFMMRSMRTVNRNFGDGPDGAYRGESPDEKSSNSSNVGDSNAS